MLLHPSDPKVTGCGRRTSCCPWPALCGGTPQLGPAPGPTHSLKLLAGVPLVSPEESEDESTSVGSLLEGPELSRKHKHLTGAVLRLECLDVQFSEP